MRITYFNPIFRIPPRFFLHDDKPWIRFTLLALAYLLSPLDLIHLVFVWSLIFVRFVIQILDAILEGIVFFFHDDHKRMDDSYISLTRICFIKQVRDDLRHFCECRKTIRG